MNIEKAKDILEKYECPTFKDTIYRSLWLFLVKANKSDWVVSDEIGWKTQLNYLKSINERVKTSPNASIMQISTEDFGLLVSELGFDEESKNHMLADYERIFDQ